MYNYTKEIYKIPDNERTTPNKISEFEYAGMLAQRISMIQDGASYMINNENDSTAEDIVKKEFKERRIPFKLRRFIGIDSKGRELYELWDPKKMTLPMKIIE
tara:strand:+ start:381 stop:686 length:306 start_codon:yes stop_codon:yes gene_type:complete